MTQKLLFSILIIFSAILPFGTLDPLTNITQTIGLGDALLALFVVCSLTLRLKSSIKLIFTLQSFLLFTIFTLLILGQVLNGYSELIKPLINIKFLICIVFFLLVSDFLKKNSNYIKYILLAFTLSCFIYSLIVLAFAPNLYEILNGRMIVLNENPNSTSSRLVIGTIYIFYLVLYDPFKKGKIKFLSLLMLPSLLIMIVLSGSRGSLLSMVIAVYLLLIFSNIKLKFKILLNFLSIASFLYLFKNLRSSEELGARWESALEGNTAGRGDIWDAVLKISYNNPMGVGESGYVEKMENILGSYIDTHNLFLYVLVCGGFFSLFLFIFLWLNVALKALNIYLVNQNVLPLILLLTILLIVFKTGGAITYLLFWFIFAIINSFNKDETYEKKHFNSSLGSI